MVLHMVHFLISLVALAAQDDDIVLFRVVHGPVDGLHPVLHHHVGRGAVRHARQDVGDDVGGLFRAGIVSGDHHEVRDFRGDAAHLGALRLIPVAAAAEQGHGTALGKVLHGAEDIFQTVGAVGIVDEDGIVLPGGGDHLHTALDMGHLGQGPGAALQGNAQGQGGPQYVQRIIYHKTPGNANPDPHFFFFCHGGEGHMVRLQLQFLRPQVRFGPLRVREFSAGGMGHEPLRPGVIGVVNAGVAVLEQQRLGVAVGLHSLMEIQVVLGEVGEDAHGIVHAVHPVQGQGVGGDLHDHVGAAALPHLGKQPLELKGLRRGALRGDDLVADHILVRADEAHLGPGLLLQNGLEEIGGGGLAVGAGDAHHGHGVRRMAEEVGAHHRQGPAGIRHLDEGNALLRCLFAQHRRRAGGHGLADEGVAVNGEARHGHEQVAGPGGPGIIADIGDVHLQIRRGVQDGQALQQFFQFHRCIPLFPVLALWAASIIYGVFCKIYSG